MDRRERGSTRSKAGVGVVQLRAASRHIAGYREVCRIGMAALYRRREVPGVLGWRRSPVVLSYLGCTRGEALNWQDKPSQVFSPLGYIIREQSCWYGLHNTQLNAQCVKLYMAPGGGTCRQFGKSHNLSRHPTRVAKSRPGPIPRNILMPTYTHPYILRSIRRPRPTPFITHYFPPFFTLHHVDRAVMVIRRCYQRISDTPVLQEDSRGETAADGSNVDSIPRASCYPNAAFVIKGRQAYGSSIS